MPSGSAIATIRSAERGDGDQAEEEHRGERAVAPPRAVTSSRNQLLSHARYVGPPQLRLACSLHPQALCESADVGEGTRVWAFAHVLPRARIGRDCNICDHVFIENDVVLGDRVTVKCGVQLWDGLRVADDVFIGPNATFSNDKYPRSKQYQARGAADVASVAAHRSAAGASSCPDCASARARWSAPAPSSRTTCQPKAIVVGNPARIVGYVDATAHPTAAPGLQADQPPSGTAIANVSRGRHAAPDAVRHGPARHARRPASSRREMPVRAEAVLHGVRRARQGRPRRARAPHVRAVSRLRAGLA